MIDKVSSDIQSTKPVSYLHFQLTEHEFIVEEKTQKNNVKDKLNIKLRTSLQDLLQRMYEEKSRRHQV